MERRKLYAVPVDLADIEILPDLCDFGCGDVVRGAPYPLSGLVLREVSPLPSSFSYSKRHGKYLHGRTGCPSVHGR